MKKISITICFSVVCAISMAQKLPWLLPPSPIYRGVSPFSEGLSLVKLREGNQIKYYFLDRAMRLSKDSYDSADVKVNGFALVQDCKKLKKGKECVWRYRMGENKFMGGEYEAVHHFNNGLAGVLKDGRWGFIDAEGAEIIKFQYDGVRPFSGGWTFGRRGNRAVLISRRGAETKVPYAVVHEFSEGLAVAENDAQEIGYIDTLRELVIPIKKKRLYASRFVEGFAVVSDTLPHLGYMNREGVVQFWFKNGTNKGSKNGSDVTDELIHYVHPFSGGLAAVKQQGKWGYIDTTGTIVIPCEYDMVTRFSEGFAAVKRGSIWFYINKLGRIVRQGGMEEPFLEALPCTEEVAWVRTSRGWGVLAVSEKLELLVESPFKKPFSGNMAPLTVQITSHRPLLTGQWELNGTVVKSKNFAPTDLKVAWTESIPLQRGRNVLKLTVKSSLEEKTVDCVLYYQYANDEAIAYQAVMIANNRYQHESWGSLDGTAEHPGNPISDADNFATLLQEQYQFHRIFTIRNANLAQMKSLMEDLTHYSDPNERILLFYAGHGDFDALNKVAYLVPTDAQGQDRNTQLPAYYFADMVNQLQSEHFLAVIDACFGGSFVLDYSSFRNTRGGGVKEKKHTQPTPGVGGQRVTSTDLEPSEKLRSREVMSSGQRVEVPNASDFMLGLMEKLRENKDKKMSARTVFERLKEPVMNKGLVPQHGILPNAGSDGGDFIFRKNKM